MLEAKAGETASLALLVEKHRRGVLHFFYRQLQDAAIAEELTQEVFLRVHRSRASYEPTAKFATWLYRIAANLVLNWRRDHDREKAYVRLDAPLPSNTLHGQLADDCMSADEWLLFETRRAEVRRAVSELPGRQRTVVLLHKFEEMEGQQIAATLGCSHQAVRSLLCRAYANLRVRLSEV